MNNRVFDLLSSYPRILVFEAYTNELLGAAVIDNVGRINRYHMSPLVPDTLETSKIPEVRFLAGEVPIVYYETKNSEKFLKGDSKLPTKTYQDS